MKSNYEHLLELIGSNGEAAEFAEAFKNEKEVELKEAEDSYKQAVEDKESAEQELEDLNQHFELRGTGDIDCGVGVIRYETKGSIDLDSIMEALKERIKKDGFKSVLRLLEYDLIPA